MCSDMRRLVSVSGIRKTVRFDALQAPLSDCDDRRDVFGHAQYRATLSEALAAVLPPEGVLSYDVFDTFLLRDDVSEYRRFLELAERVAAHVGCDPVDAFVARHLGTRASYRAGRRVKGCAEGSLSEIHRTAARLLGCDATAAETFVEIELDYEAERLSVNQALMELARWHRARGGRVIAISDMYMHAEQIERLMARIVPGHPVFDVVYSSADTKVSKASGHLFDLVRADLDVRDIDCVHVGDSLHGDFRRARERGWKALHLPVATAEIARRRQDHVIARDRLLQEREVAVEMKLPA